MLSILFTGVLIAIGLGVALMVLAMLAGILSNPDILGVVFLMTVPCLILSTYIGWPDTLAILLAVVMLAKPLTWVVVKTKELFVAMFGNGV
jgi:hypothetical protein